MNKKIKNYFTVTLAALFIFGFSLWGVLSPDKEMSVSERRKLATFPEISYENIYSGKFMTDFETYSLEQFPIRDSFRGLKANAVYNGFLMKDNNGIFIRDGHIFKTEYPYNAESVNRATDIFKDIYDKYLNDGNNIYVSVIPDKNYFIGADSGQLVMDYSKLFSAVRNNMNYADYIDITGLLTLDDYYYTDSHWRQEKIVPVARYLLSSMGNKPSDRNYTENVSPIPFYGVYYGQSAVKTEADTLRYLTDSVISNAQVYDYETEKNISVYDTEKLSSADPYETFLSGSKSLLTVDNPDALTDKELIVFRDSFGSSIAPLLLDGYSRITLIDIRYLPSSALGEYVDFTNSDVLFLYSASVLNNSITLK